MMEARRRIDTCRGAGASSPRSRQQGPRPSRDSAPELTKKSLHAQIASAQRLDHTIAEAQDRLRLTNARLDEAVARAAELSIQAGDVHDLQGLGDDVDSLVDDLEALRLGLEELDRPSTGTS